jgi:DNA-binding transcriptional MerR regulator
MGKEKQFFKSQQVREIIGLTRRQMQYWASTDLVVPSYTTAGGHARYTFEDLVALKTAKRLLGAGVSVQRIRNVMSELKNVLPKIKRPLSELTLVATGDVILVFYEDTVFEAITGQQWILELAEIQRDIEKWEKKFQGLRKYRRVPVKADSGIGRFGEKIKPYGAEKVEGQGT